MSINIKKALKTFVIFILLMFVLNLNEINAQSSFAPQQQNAGQVVGTAGMDTSAANEVIGGGTAFGQQKVYTGQKITLDFQDASVQNVIRLIAEVSGKNVVIGDRVTGNITLTLRDVPWDQALDIVLKQSGLGMEESNNVILISDAASLRQAEEARRAAIQQTVQDANTLPIVKEVYTPRYAPVEAIRVEMDKVKSTRGKVTAIGNDIYVEDDPSIQEMMAQILLRNDRVARQILIEAKIIEASSNFTQNIGINWNGLGSHGATLGSGTTANPGYDAEINVPSVLGNVDKLLPDAQIGGSGFNNGALNLGLGFLNKSGTFGLTASLQASEVSGDTKVISAPRIMAANDEQVNIKQGTQIPYTSVSDGDSSTEFIEAVLELSVTPHIEENGEIITLEIDLTKDSPGDIISGAQPSINTKSAKTKLMVKDGTTVIIGGIITDIQGTSSRRVPTVHRIPLLGWLFKDRGVTANKDELLIFITANIIPVTI